MQGVNAPRDHRQHHGRVLHCLLLVITALVGLLLVIQLSVWIAIPSQLKLLHLLPFGASPELPTEDSVRAIVRSERHRPRLKHLSAAEGGGCENTVQGVNLVTDSEGFVCKPSSIDSSGCCSENEDREQHTCNKCHKDSCCPTYEHCVSCCLRDDHDELRNRARLELSFHPFYKDDTSPFAWCTFTCRPSSGSLRHQNEYDPGKLYCFNPLEVKRAWQWP